MVGVVVLVTEARRGRGESRFVTWVEGLGPGQWAVLEGTVGAARAVWEAAGPSELELD